MRWFKKIARIASNKVFNDALDEAIRSRKSAEKKIRRMQADLDICSESWFLTPKQTLDECIPKDIESK